MDARLRVLRHASVSLCLLVAACTGGGASHRSTIVAEPGGAPATYGATSMPARTGPYDMGASAHASTDGPAIADPTPERPGLGTTFGEDVYAPISFAPFQRASSSPWAEVALHYNDADGVAAHAQYLGVTPEPLEVPAGDGSLAVALVDEGGRTLPGVTTRGRALIIGEDGARYRIVVRNTTGVRFEVVASVDGLDVIDGKPADPNRRGYIVDPSQTLVIDGFRTSDASVAAFRFGRVAESYAAQTSGDRNVGVVGLAIFAERGAVWNTREIELRDSADPFPQRGYAVPPR